MTGAATGARARSAQATTWTITPTTCWRWSNISTLMAPSTSATRPAGARWCARLARHGQARALKAVLIAAVPPLMLQTPDNPGGLPREVFDDFQHQVATNRAQFYRDVPAGPFHGYNRPGATPSEGIIGNWWRQGMMGAALAHYDGVVPFSQTDFRADLKKITLPVLVQHGDDDQIVPHANAGPLSAALLPNGTLKTYPGFPHGMPTTHADVINADILAFIERC